MLIKGRYIKPSTIKRERVYKEHKEYLIDNDYMNLPEELEKIEILKRLKSDEDYYGDFGKQYMSNSDIWTLLKEPEKYGKGKEETVPMVAGRYFHVSVLEPEKKHLFNIVESSTRSTKQYKEVSEGKILLLKKEQEHLDYLINKMKSNFRFHSDIFNPLNQYEVPGITELFGLKWKGKADIITPDVLIDIKTTSNIDKFKWSSRDYNYDSQAYIYQQIFGKPVIFYVVCKVSGRLGIFKPTEQFLIGGREKVQKAIEVYNNFFIKDAKMEITQHITEEDL